MPRPLRAHSPLLTRNDRSNAIPDHQWFAIKSESHRQANKRGEIEQARQAGKGDTGASEGADPNSNAGWFRSTGRSVKEEQANAVAEAELRRMRQQYEETASTSEPTPYVSRGVTDVLAHPKVTSEHQDGPEHEATLDRGVEASCRSAHDGYCWGKGCTVHVFMREVRGSHELTWKEWQKMTGTELTAAENAGGHANPLVRSQEFPTWRGLHQLDADHAALLRRLAKSDPGSDDGTRGSPYSTIEVGPKQSLADACRDDELIVAEQTAWAEFNQPAPDGYQAGHMLTIPSHELDSARFGQANLTATVQRATEYPQAIRIQEARSTHVPHPQRFPKLDEATFCHDHYVSQRYDPPLSPTDWLSVSQSHSTVPIDDGGARPSSSSDVRDTISGQSAPSSVLGGTRTLIHPRVSALRWEG